MNSFATFTPNEGENLAFSVRVGEDSKTGIVRFVPLNSAARAVIDARTRARLAKGVQPWVFVSIRGKGPYERTSVSNAFKRTCEEAARALRKKGQMEAAERIDAATFHSCRHTFASWAIQGGENGKGAIPIALVQQYLGHTDDHMTRKYAHLAPANQKPGASLEALAESCHCANIAQDACSTNPDSVSS